MGWFGVGGICCDERRAWARKKGMVSRSGMGPAELGLGCSERRAAALGTQPQPDPKYTAPLLSSGHWKETTKPKGTWQNPSKEEQPPHGSGQATKHCRRKKTRWTPNLQKRFSKQREKITAWWAAGRSHRRFQQGWGGVMAR